MALMFTIATWPMAAFADVPSPKPSLKHNSKIAAHVPPPAKPPGNMHVRTGPRSVKLIVPTLSFSNPPTDLEISTARVLWEPLAPMTGQTAAGKSTTQTAAEKAAENSALANALVAFKNNREDLSPLTKFIDTYPNSRWRPAVELNLGLLQFYTGYLIEALADWQSVWERSKNEQGSPQRAIANRAMARLLVTDARLGRQDELIKYFAETKHRGFFGSDEEMVNSAREGLWQMSHMPECSFKCGPLAINSILNIGKKVPTGNPVIQKAVSTKQGTNLAQVKGWADQVGLKYQAAKRSPGAKVIVPAVMHWKVGHFAAIVGENNGRYILKDGTFDMDATLAMTPNALDAETDGYFLVPAGTLPAGWQPISDQEAKTVWGKGNSVAFDDNQMRPPACKKSPAPSGDSCPGGGCASGGASGGDGGGGGAGGGSGSSGVGGGIGALTTGMAQAYVWSMNATLNVVDTPLGYKPPIGPKMDFRVNYNNMETNQPSSFTFTNFGPDWTFNWLSYLTVNSGTQVATVRVRGGGSEVYTPNMGVYPPDLLTQAVLVSMGGGVYQRQLPDGSIEVFSQADGLGNIFMTEVIDPQGQSAYVQYDPYFRISDIKDALGQMTTVSYVSSMMGNVGFYKVASIRDPFGRLASFGYDSTTTNLTSITDVIGLVSQFAYDTSATFIVSMTTPYGTTSFNEYSISQSPNLPARGLQFGFPDGTFAVLESFINGTKTTYYWNREVAMLYPGNGNQCEQTTWLILSYSSGIEEPVPATVRPPQPQPYSTMYGPALDTAYTYPGQVLPQEADVIGSSNKPATVYNYLGQPNVILTLGGTVHPGDTLSLGVQSQPYNFGTGYLVQMGDTLSSIASGLAAAISATPDAQAIGLIGVASGPTITLNSNEVYALGFEGQTGYNPYFNNLATETVTMSSQKQTQSVNISGTVNSGDNLNLKFAGTQLSSSPQVNYLTVTGDTDTTVAAGLTAAINASSILAQYNTTATSSGPNIYVTSYLPGNLDLTSEDQGGLMFTYSVPVDTSNGYYQYQYNSIGQVTQSIDPVSRTFSYQYAANNIDLQQITETQGTDNFQIGAWTYNSQHEPLTYTDGSGQVTQYTYYMNGQLKTVTDANSDVWTYSYNSDNYLTEIQGPLSGSADVTMFSYDFYGRLYQVTDSEGYVLTYSYDNANRLTQTTYPDGTSEQIVYNNLDAVLKKDRIGRWTQDSYNSMDQLAFEIDPLGRKTQYTWCACGALASLTDPSGNTTTWQHDEQSRPILKTFPDQTTVSYSYDNSGGRLRSKTDALNQTTYYLSNPDNTPYETGYVNTVNPTGAVTYGYDPNYNRITSIAKVDWGTISYTYNPYIVPMGTPTTGGGMLATVSNNVIANSTTAYTYDVLGRTTNRQINGSANSDTWTYDAISRITAESNTLGSFAYNYVDNTPGSSKGTTRLASINYPNSQLTTFNWYGNTGDQRLQGINNFAPGPVPRSQFNYAYDSAGEITRWAQQNASYTPTQYSLGYDLAAN